MLNGRMSSRVTSGSSSETFYYPAHYDLVSSSSEISKVFSPSLPMRMSGERKGGKSGFPGYIQVLPSSAGFRSPYSSSDFNLALIRTSILRKRFSLACCANWIQQPRSSRASNTLTRQLPGWDPDVTSDDQPCRSLLNKIT